MVINNGGSGTGSGSNSAFEGLMAMLLSDKLGIDLKSTPNAEPSEEIKRIRESILKSLNEPARTSDAPLASTAAAAAAGTGNGSAKPKPPMPSA